VREENFILESVGKVREEEVENICACGENARDPLKCFTILRCEIFLKENSEMAQFSI
jgi:hypothetical protein